MNIGFSSRRLIENLLKYLVFVFILFHFSKIICEGSLFLESVFHEAQEAYAQGDFQKAASDFTRIIQTGFQSGEIYYNIGNCYFKLNQLGKAILYYERAKRLLKRDKELQMNLDLVRASLKRQSVEFKEGFLLKPFREVGGVINLWELTLLNVIVGWLLFLATSLRLVIVKKIFNKIIGILILFQILALSFWYALYLGDKTPKAIVLAKEIESHSGPGESFPINYKIYEGSKLSIEAQYGEWAKISFSREISGWIKSDGYEQI